ncbi:energy-coupling factor transporter ATPase [Methanolobus halotolerans]|uniref:Energy-coupling factor transporter ATPase n=1 Tax=Methanolobus halotolerans TaxID=2052935 RepID=A0A4E0PZQ2_9EURY|nr:energy-coupling factor transporter ATPase [Methanolobus halotolerans]TGC11132.1 energy-coupling factor transporter ATPase [Methanolobus halotolerans]
MIEITTLNHRYPGGKLSLDSVDLHIEKGEFVVIAGRNGSGKSTLVRHMNALLLPSSGSVKVKGYCTAKNANLREIRRTVGMVFQNPDSQFVGMTVEEDIAFGLENTGTPPERVRQLVDEILELMELSDYKKYTPRSLSGGQRQMIAIAGVLVMEPECMVFDEITSMLDPTSRKEILATIHHINKKGTTVVHVTHMLEEAVGADRLIVMDSGKIVLEGSPDDVFTHPDIIQKHGMELPPVAELSRRLYDSGIIKKKIVFSRDELVEELCRSM